MPHKPSVGFSKTQKPVWLQNKHYIIGVLAGQGRNTKIHPLDENLTHLDLPVRRRWKSHINSCIFTLLPHESGVGFSYKENLQLKDVNSFGCKITFVEIVFLLVRHCFQGTKWNDAAKTAGRTKKLSSCDIRRDCLESFLVWRFYTYSFGGFLKKR